MTTDADQPDPEQPVHHQLEAYNARDIDAFMACWSEDCRYCEFPDRLLAQGAPAVRARHLVRFREPNLFGHLHSRTTIGNLVVDHETVTRTFPKGFGPEGPGEIDVLALYQVEDGRIAQAWFKMGPPRLHPPGTITIRPAAPADAAACRTLTRTAYAKWVPLIGREPRPMTADVEAALRNHRIDLLFRDGHLAALIETIPKPDHLLIENVAVLPSAQGQGLSRKLLAHAENLAKTLGHTETRLYTNKAFAENIRLYERCHYTIDREEPFINGIAVHMSKRLA